MSDAISTPAWDALISPADWAVCHAVIKAMRHAGIDFLLGGAFGMALYTGKFRRPTDLDLFVLPSQVPHAIEALSAAGFIDDYFAKPYERSWRHRWTRGAFAIDLIFGLANGRAVVDLLWFAQARNHPSRRTAENRSAGGNDLEAALRFAARPLRMAGHRELALRGGSDDGLEPSLQSRGR